MILLGSGGYPGENGPFDFVEEDFTPSGGQIGTMNPVFTLGSVPIDPESVVCFVNGKEEDDLTISGDLVTIHLTYTLDGTDTVHFEYTKLT